MKRLIASIAATLALATFAMPTNNEVRKAAPIVKELMDPLVSAFRAKKKSAVEVGDAAMGYAREATTDGAKFLLLKGAIWYFAQAKEDAKAVAAIAALTEQIKDIPPEVIRNDILKPAIDHISEQSVPGLFAQFRSASAQIEVAKLGQLVKRNKADEPARRRYAELLAVTGDWKAALEVFAKLRDVKAVQAAKEEIAGKTLALAGDFWWDYKPSVDMASEAAKVHAVTLYRRAIASGELTGLKKVIAEKRIAEVEATGRTGGSPVSVTAGTSSSTVTQSATGTNKLVQVCKLLGFDFPEKRPAGHDDEKFIPLKHPLPGVTCVRLFYANDGLSRVFFTNFEYDKAIKAVAPFDFDNAASWEAANQLRSLIEEKTGFKLPDWEGDEAHRHIHALCPNGLNADFHFKTKVSAAGDKRMDLWLSDAVMESKRKLEIQQRELAEKALPKEKMQLFPRLDPDPNAWAWTTERPSQGWQLPNFNDSSWGRTAGGFGNKSRTSKSKAEIATRWKAVSEAAWLRRHFRYSASGGKVLNAVFEIYHDRDVVVYLNGIPLTHDYGFVNDWKPYVVSGSRFSAAVKEGDNVIAVKVVNENNGLRYIDLGLSVNVAK